MAKVKVTIEIEADSLQDAITALDGSAVARDVAAHNTDPRGRHPASDAEIAAYDKAADVQPAKNKGGRPKKTTEAPPADDVFSQAQPTTAPAEITGAVAPSADDMFADTEAEEGISDSEFLSRCQAVIAKANNQGDKIRLVQEKTREVSGNDAARFKAVPVEKRAAVLEAIEALKF